MMLHLLSFFARTSLTFWRRMPVILSSLCGRDVLTAGPVLRQFLVSAGFCCVFFLRFSLIVQVVFSCCCFLPTDPVVVSFRSLRASSDLYRMLYKIPFPSFTGICVFAVISSSGPIFLVTGCLRHRKDWSWYHFFSALIAALLPPFCSMISGA